MFHPLITDLKSLKDSDLDQKLEELTRKYWLTSNQEVRYQMTVLIDMYQAELKIRRDALMKSHMEKRNKDMDNLIKVR
jgi:hypothetical protein